MTLEAFLARKPVITTTDAGGPLEFVEHGVNGLVAAPTPDAVADAVARLAGDAVGGRQARRGRTRARAPHLVGRRRRAVDVGRAPGSAVCRLVTDRTLDDVLVIVPTFNERENIAALVPRLLGHRRRARADRGRRVARRHRHGGRRPGRGQRRTPHGDASHRPARARTFLRGRHAGRRAHRRALRLPDGRRPVARSRRSDTAASRRRHGGSRHRLALRAGRHAAQLAAPPPLAERVRQLVRARRHGPADPRLHERLPLLAARAAGAPAARRDRLRRLRVPGGDGVRGAGVPAPTIVEAPIALRRAAAGRVEALGQRHRGIRLDAVAPGSRRPCAGGPI